ncbi:MAG: HugZ family protein [Lentisphaeraceae bacterium]|nr:HugZ family protein [Lentisphaeraceae bacterium]
MENNFTPAVKAMLARTLLKGEKDGVLSTMSKELPGYPFGSVTPYSFDGLGRPVILISAIAQHTHNIDADSRVSLTVIETTADRDVQAHGRVTYIGDARKMSDADEFGKFRYLCKFPHAKNYFQAHSFNFYVIEPVRVRYIRGFGEIFWIEKEEFARESIFDLESEKFVLDHMNNDHRCTLSKYCRQYNLNLKEDDYLMTAIDAEGFEISAGSQLIRINFQEPLRNADDARHALVSLAKED